MTYTFSQNELDAITSAYNNAEAGTAPWFSVYQTISSAISTDGVADAGVDPAVLVWVNGATEVNADTGVFSEFIRSYSVAQYNFRFDGAPAMSLQDVSNAVAKGVAEDILTNHQLPSLYQVGLLDAGPAIANYFHGDPAGWSGNPLFLFLGEDRFFRGTILHEPTSTEPTPSLPEDRYDLLAFIESSVTALGDVDSLASLSKRIYDTTVSTGVGPLNTIGIVSSAMFDAETLLEKYYGHPLSYLMTGCHIELGKSGSDDISAGTTSWLIDGGAGNDTISGGSSDDILDGGGDSDILMGHNGFDRIVGGDGDDILVGGTATGLTLTTNINLTSNHSEWDDGVGDRLMGGNGNDTYLIHLKEGDTWEWAGLYDFNQQKAAALLDVIDTVDEYYGDGVGQIKIQLYHEYFDPGEQYQEIGVAGNYQYSYTDEFGRVKFYTDSSGRELALYDVIDPELGGTYPCLFVMAGYPASPVVAIKDFYQGDFGITLDGYTNIRPENGQPQPGNDFNGTGSPEDFAGGRNDDAVGYAASNEGVHIDLAAGAGSGGDAAGDHYSSIENATGSNHNDVITGSQKDNQLFGLDGNDTIDTGTGTDLVDGGSGDDQILLGTGEKYVNGGNGTDMVVLAFDRSDYTVSNSNGTVHISGNGVSALITNVEVLRFNDGDVSVGTQAVPDILGTPNDDTIYGTNDADVIRGLAGNDYLDGMEGADTIHGGKGDDTVAGALGSDVYIYANNDGNDTVWDGPESGAVDVLRFKDLNLRDLTMTRSGEDLVITVNDTNETITLAAQYHNAAENYAIEKLEFADGSSLDLEHGNDTNWIYGTAAADTISGNWGKDYVIGGLGNDTLSGSAGGDVYIYSRGDGNDVINDGTGFSDNVDVLHFTNINAADITLAKHGNDLIVSIDGNSASIVIEDQYHAANDPYWGIEKIEFANGTVWNQQDIAEHLAA